jgi:hypothetical protein
MIQSLFTHMTGGGIKVVAHKNSPINMIIFLLILIVDILLRTFIFMYCYNNVVPKMNLNLREINFNESLLIIIMVSCLIGK